MNFFTTKYSSSKQIFIAIKFLIIKNRHNVLQGYDLFVDMMFF